MKGSVRLSSTLIRFEAEYLRREYTVVTTQPSFSESSIYLASVLEIALCFHTNHNWKRDDKETGAMFQFTPLLGALSNSPASQSLLELDGGIKILIDVGWDEKFDIEKLKDLER